MPDEIILDISKLNIGDSIKCGTISVSDNITMVSDKEEVAVAVVKPGVEKVDEDEEEGEDAVASEEEVVTEETA